MQRRIVCSLSTVVVWAILLAVPNAAQAGPFGSNNLWYNGDFDANTDQNPPEANGGYNALANNYGGLNDGFNVVFDQVNVGVTWNVTTVYSNDLMSTANVSDALWYIYSGTSGTMNGSTPVAYGESAATVTATGNADPALDLTEYTVAVTGLSITLAPGTYFLAVVPVLDSGNSGLDQSYISYTAGLNAVGSPNGTDGNSFYYSTSFGYDFTRTNSVWGPNPDNPNGYDYSMGMDGNVVPEPSSLTLLIVGLTCCLGGRTIVSRRFRRRQAVT